MIHMFNHGVMVYAFNPEHALRMATSLDGPIVSSRSSFFRGVHIGDELFGFSVWVMQIAFAQFSNRVVPTHFIRMRLMDKPVLREVVSKSAGNMIHRRCIAKLILQRELNRRWSESNTHPVKQGEDRLIDLSHPRNPRRRH
jgi:hypothetical protein